VAVIVATAAVIAEAIVVATEAVGFAEARAEDFAGDHLAEVFRPSICFAGSTKTATA
jgi:hypothetical protein